ncbi:hypothetical protein acdb102_10750 [Acidothermaceae bacterium B102]|nr:hypothetical protein acdb102_10750 [Acidothermaceae bacterium B102]
MIVALVSLAALSVTVEAAALPGALPLADAPAATDEAAAAEVAAMVAAEVAAAPAALVAPEPAALELALVLLLLLPHAAVSRLAATARLMTGTPKRVFMWCLL